MARRKHHIEEDSDRVSLTPMIDIVFLLLAYFMVTTAIQKEEGDLGVQLPINSKSESTLQPVEAIISIMPDASILMNQQPYDHFDSREMPDLTEALKRLSQSATAEGVPMVVTIQADDDSIHQRAVDALNACAAAGISMVTFGDPGE